MAIAVTATECSHPPFYPYVRSFCTLDVALIAIPV